MFDKVLIANRGEIACRVMDTCRRMGVGAVAVYSDADAGARHVALADEAVRIGAAPVGESYLQGERIIAAARATGAQAIHPGYGFLSENPEFAQAVVDAGLAWIGPPAQAIRAMGLKDAAKALMEKAGVPVVPGYHGADQADEVLQNAARDMGYPVLIKAVAGGGGKGMRLVETDSEFAEALAGARSEARAAFGNADVLVEKFIENPRHIEVQVFGDTFGAAVHLFERDCSLQRRHQKVIEEAPAPGMTEAVRAAMGAAAVRAAQAIGYAGAGTVEFIVDGSGALREDGFWFMEMNTRLQVEHPVTEAITGIDLVEWQLRVACGEPLPASQDQLFIDGHAFEARIYAEDVPKGFLPATGRLTVLRFPPDARADTGVREGDTITPYYDPMIAKLVTHGPTRASALRRLSRALAQTRIAGSVTNLDFLQALSRHEGFAAGDVDTGLIARDIDALTQEAQPEAEDLALAAVEFAGMASATGFSIWTPLRQTIRLEHNGEVHDVVLSVTRNGILAQVGDRSLNLTHRDGWIVDDARRPVEVLRTPTGVSLFGALTFHFSRHDPLSVATSESAGAGTITAPMPGLVKALRVTEGDVVTAGQVLAVLEAMKMEHQMRAPFDGTVAEVAITEGAQVADGALLLRMEEPQDG